jgi:uncharacterized protein
MIRTIPPGRGAHRGRTLKIVRENAEGKNYFTAYGEGWVDVAGKRFSASLAVCSDRLIEGWAAGDMAALTGAETAPLLDLNPEIVLLGSGARFRFPDPAALAPLFRAGVGVEVMDTKAACRTYNILLAEGRRVVAALVVSDTGA